MFSEILPECNIVTVFGHKTSLDMWP